MFYVSFSALHLSVSSIIRNGVGSTWPKSIKSLNDVCSKSSPGVIWLRERNQTCLMLLVEPLFLSQYSALEDDGGGRARCPPTNVQDLCFRQESGA